MRILRDIIKWVILVIVSVVDIWCKIVAFVQAPESSEGAGEETGALAVVGGVVGTVFLVAALA